MGNCLFISKNRTFNSTTEDQTAANELDDFNNLNVQRTGVCPSFHCKSASTAIPFNSNTAAKKRFVQQKLLNDRSSCDLIADDLRPGEPEKLVAIFKYESRSEGDLGFEKDDVMYLLYNSNPDWWYVRNSKGLSGYVPRNFVAFLKTPEAYEWYAGRIPRSMAERLVAARHLPPGTFLIRERESDVLEYALTIRDIDQGHGPCVKHYKIKRMNNESGFFITTRMIFPSLEALVTYYSERSDGLCNNLTIPAPKLTPVRLDLCFDTQQNWEIPRQELELLRKLGSGHFAEVWYGHWRGKVDVAIKMMKGRTMSPEDFIAEANIMKQCQHTNLVRLFAVCTKEEPFYIITEYMQNGSLLDYLRAEIKYPGEQGRAHPKNPLDMKAMVDICAQVANGMRYLEERKLVHRDLAARNVLVGEKISGVPIVKVADFGLARKLEDEEEIYEAQPATKFPIRWTAPEASLFKTFTVKSDVWSYGVLLYEIFSRGAIPYAGMSNGEVLSRVESGERMSCPYSRDREEKALIKRIYDQMMLKTWERLPENRPTFETLYHYFDDFFVNQQSNYIPP